MNLVKGQRPGNDVVTPLTVIVYAWELREAGSFSILPVKSRSTRFTLLPLLFICVFYFCLVRFIVGWKVVQQVLFAVNLTAALSVR